METMKQSVSIFYMYQFPFAMCYLSMNVDSTLFYCIIITLFLIQCGGSGTYIFYITRIFSTQCVKMEHETIQFSLPKKCYRLNHQDENSADVQTLWNMIELMHF